MTTQSYTLETSLATDERLFEGALEWIRIGLQGDYRYELGWRPQSATIIQIGRRRKNRPSDLDEIEEIWRPEPYTKRIEHELTPLLIGPGTFIEYRAPGTYLLSERLHALEEFGPLLITTRITENKTP